MISSKCRSTGFTLIELLIVIAIILILIAIVLPNFLEAQMRAKVVRADADMKSIGTALETYAIDYNGRYPVWPSNSGLRFYATVNDPFQGFLSPLLTTPNKYVTSLPRDLFVNEPGPTARVRPDIPHVNIYGL